MNIFKKLFRSSDKSDSNLKKKLNIEKLLESKDINSTIIIIDNFICQLCSSDGDLDKLTGQQKNFHYIQELEREVNNGGFFQYFFNSSGDFTHETISALKAIKAGKTVKILQMAIDPFPNKTVPKDREERQIVLSTIEEATKDIWNHLDQHFFAYEDDLHFLNIEYIRKYKEKF